MRRSVKTMEVYDPQEHENLRDFMESSYLIDIDLFTPLNYQMHLNKGLSIAFLTFDTRLNL